MNLFKKKSDVEVLEKITENKAKTPKHKFINQAKKKYGTYAIAITAAVIAVAVGLNILVGVLAARVNIDLDLSFEGDNTLTEENVEFLNSLTTDVKLIVCSDKEGYTGGYVEYYTANQQYNATDSTGKYYAQTIRFLELYDRYEHIEVEFADPQSPEFSAVMKQYSAANLSYGDIIVAATHTVDGKENVRSSIVTFDEIYYLADESGYASMGYGQYTVGGNYFETAVSSEIKKVSATETKKVGVVGTHCLTTVTEYYEGVLSLNNFEIFSIEDAVIESIPDDLSVLLIAAPTSDFSISELEVIDSWLYNNGQRGRGIIFFASVNSPELPNLYNYLLEWGIKVGSGVLYDTNSQSHMQNDNYTMLFVSETGKGEDITDAIVGSSSSYIIGTSAKLSTAFEKSGLRATYVPIKTYSTAVVEAPIGSTRDWEPTDDYEKSQQIGMIVSREEDFIDNESKKSYVVAFSSPTIVSSELASYTTIGNIDAAVNTANLVSGVEDTGLSFFMKTIDTESFYTKVTESSANIIKLIFQWLIPLSLVVWGVVVFVRRVRR